MRPLRVALAQIEPRLGLLEENVEIHLDAIDRAREAGANVVVFPELALSGYVLRDQVPDVACRADSPHVGAIVRRSRDVDVVFGWVEESGDHRFFNSAAYASGGTIVHVHRKVFLPTYGLFEEGRDLARGDALRAFDTPHGRFGILLCEDVWHPTSAWLLAHDGAQVLIVPSSGPSRGTAPDRGLTSVEVWDRLLTVTSQFFTAFTVYVNRIGFEDGLHFGGGSMVHDPFGRLLARADSIEPALLVADLDPELLRRARTAYPLLRDGQLDVVARELERVRAARSRAPDTPRPPQESP